MKKSSLLVLSVFLLLSVFQVSARADTVVKTTIVDDGFRVGVFLYFTQGVPVANVNLISSIVQEAVGSVSESTQVQKPQTITTPSIIQSEVGSLFQSPLPNNWDAFIAVLSYPSENQYATIYKSDLFVDPGTDDTAQSLIGPGFQYLLSVETRKDLADGLSAALNELLD